MTREQTECTYQGRLAESATILKHARMAVLGAPLIGRRLLATSAGSQRHRAE